MHTQTVQNATFKDVVLDQLSSKANVAQFVSFGPDLHQRFSRIHGYARNSMFDTLEQALTCLLRSSPEESVNVRSYAPDNAKSRQFVYGLRTVDAALSTVSRLAEEGLFTIVNETVDVNDGGISGVAAGDMVEFAPGDTPRCVEKPGTVSLPRQLGMQLLETVYHFRPTLAYLPELRIEFSIHPLRRGYRHDHTIVWEMEEVGAIEAPVGIRWPNLFSRLIGDKAFGLLVAHELGFPVPACTVFLRSLPPFTFGKKTNTGETWIRTCPVEQVPGRYTTHHGWLDPFELLAREDPSGEMLASVLAQEGVDAEYSGALISSGEGLPIVEGVKGHGEDFMQGRKPGSLPDETRHDVVHMYDRLKAKLGGPVGFEWVHDGRHVWILQLHCGATPSSGITIVPGQPESFLTFDVENGIEALRDLVDKANRASMGIILIGEVGITSHFGDILRRAGTPSKIQMR